MDGTVGSFIRLASSAAEASKQVGLRDGEILSIRIGEFLGAGRYAVVVRGSVLTVRSTVPLETGRIIQARVVFSGQRVELRLIESIAPGHSAGTGRVGVGPSSVPSALTNLIVQSMRRSGLPISPESMAAISMMIPRTRRKDPSFIRFATILFDKHLRVDSGFVEELYRTIAGDRRQGSGGERSGQEGGRRFDSAEQAHGSEEKTGGTTPGAESEAIEGAFRPSLAERRTLREELRAQLQGKGSHQAGWWALFNHLPGRHETWVVVPFDLEREEITLDGSIRVLLSPAPSHGKTAGLPISRAVVVVNGVGAFEIGGYPPHRVTAHADTAALRKRLVRLLPELSEKLRNLGVEVDDTINGGKNFDGFSSETMPMQGVDAVV